MRPTMYIIVGLSPLSREDDPESSEGCNEDNIPRTGLAEDLQGFWIRVRRNVLFNGIAVLTHLEVGILLRLKIIHSPTLFLTLIVF
jgi:hypothetical protein